jgi:Arc/MetJ family transcription regulator
MPSLRNLQRHRPLARGVALRDTRPWAPVWLKLPYLYGKTCLMKKTLHIDEELLAQARVASNASTDTETVRLGLEALIRSAAYQRMRSLLGSEKGPIKDVPRRREPAKRKERARRSA